MWMYWVAWINTPDFDVGCLWGAIGVRGTSQILPYKRLYIQSLLSRHFLAWKISPQPFMLRHRVESNEQESKTLTMGRYMETYIIG